MLNSELAVLTEAGVLGVTEVVCVETADQFLTMVKKVLKTNHKPHENILFSIGWSSSAMLAFPALHHGKG